MSGNEEDCRITLYLDTPKMFLKPGFDNIYGRKLKGGTTETTWYTGHAFIGLTDEKGNEQKWGFGPKSDVKDSLLVYITGCPSYFKREEGSHYNEAVVYPISKQQYLAAAKKIDELQKHPELKYKLFSRNCSTVSTSILNTAGVDAPSKLIGLTPHGLTIKKRLMYAARKIQVDLIKAVACVKRFFGQKAAPKREILDLLKRKPLPVALHIGSKNGEKGGKLDVQKAMNYLATGMVAGAR